MNDVRHLDFFAIFIIFLRTVIPALAMKFVYDVIFAVVNAL